MKTRSIEEITDDLHLLSLVQDKLEKELQQTIEQEKRRIIASSPFVLTDSEASRRVKKTTKQWRTEKKDVFQVGDRVYIQNEVTPAFIVANSKDRKATVLKIQGDRCHIFTDNDIKTHRKKQFLDALIEEN